jgi:hypothetical protein
MNYSVRQDIKGRSPAVVARIVLTTGRPTSLAQPALEAIDSGDFKSWLQRHPGVEIDERTALEAMWRERRVLAYRLPADMPQPKDWKYVDMARLESVCRRFGIL